MWRKRREQGKTRGLWKWHKNELHINDVPTIYEKLKHSWSCHKCYSTKNLQEHHIIAGDNKNTLTLCSHHHHALENQLKKSLIEFFIQQYGEEKFIEFTLSVLDHLT